MPELGMQIWYEFDPCTHQHVYRLAGRREPLAILDQVMFRDASSMYQLHRQTCDIIKDSFDHTFQPEWDERIEEE